MRIKKLLFISLTVLVVFLVYLSTVDKKVYYLNLGDSIALGKNSYRVRGKSYDYYIKEYLNEQKKLEKFINEFNKEDLRITDLYNMIEDNYKININGHSQSIKNALIKADVVTLTVGNDSFYSKLSGNYSLNELYEIIDEYKEDMEKREDSRYIHRGKFPWKLTENIGDPDTVQGKLFPALSALERLRREEPVFAGDARVWTVETGNCSVLGIGRRMGDELLIALFNFHEMTQEIELSA